MDSTMAPVNVKRVKLDFTEHIDVLVGPERKRFIVHKDVILARSPFFKAATSELWKKDQPQHAVVLPEEEPKLFAAYLQCLYQGVVMVDQRDEDTSRIPEISRLYILADKLGDVRSSNLIIDAIMEESDEENVVPGFEAIQQIYSNTAQGSPLRRLVVDYALFESCHTVMEDVTVAASPDFLLDFFHEYKTIKHGDSKDPLAARFKTTLSETRAKCYYHSHNDEHPACGKSDAVKAGIN